MIFARNKQNARTDGLVVAGVVFRPHNPTVHRVHHRGDSCSFTETPCRWMIKINRPDQQGCNAYHYACLQGNEKMCKALNALKGSPMGRNQDGYTAFHIAAQYGHTKCVKRMLAAPALRKAGDWAVEECLNLKTKSGCSALLLASREGHVDIVKMLLEKGARVNAKDKAGSAAIHYAALIQNDEIVDALLEYV